MAAKATTKVLLTKEEQALLTKLAPNVQALFKDRVESEVLDSYESEEELVDRLSKTSYDKYPEVKAMLDKLMTSGNLDDFDMEAMPDGALDVLLFSIGACGISALVELSLQDTELDADAAEAIAALTKARHRVLTVNSGK
ncbi:MAG TPA: hypothetical protein PKV72_03200 [Candidatus Peribacteria bacterium]|nr:hypothetical protein [Candidatus Peribacteria bacterium]